MKDVRSWLEASGPEYLLASLRRLETNTAGTPFCDIPASLSWIDAHFPKPKGGKHPRPELCQGLTAYMKWRADLIRAVEIVSGAATAKTARRAQVDGWTELIAAGKLHTKNPGLIHTASLSSLSILADTARRADVEPWNLAEEGVLDRLEDAFMKQDDRGKVRKAQRLLNDFAFIPELASLLPEEPVRVFLTSRQYDALPPHLDAVLVKMANEAGSERDHVTGKDGAIVKDATIQHYLAALRHHIRTLTKCAADAALGYDQPIKDLTSVGDVRDLLTSDHLQATIRQTEEEEHLPGTLSQSSAYGYYNRILIVLSRNEIDTSKIYRSIQTSVFLRQGKELAKGMNPNTQAWCEALLNEPNRERIFSRMHLILMAKADKILSAAEAEGRRLTDKEITKARQLGTCAAACAIELAGRPIRLSNVTGLRISGSRRNFFRPSKGRPDYTFRLFADETKSGNPEEPVPLRKELHGPQVLDWYLLKIRPLFEHAKESIYLFPAVEKPKAKLGKATFDKWFQSAVAGANLPMTFHLWRHGYATLLLDTNWSNLRLAADMLGNTPAVCARSYVWLNKPKIFRAGQDETIKRMRAHQ
ncbi:site-specific integrase [Sulfitobacter brevis]|nr:site-specific integrase [Sulfitobacter brevis]